MIFEIRNSLTSMNCTSALDLSSLLFSSPYSNNEVRMLYASAHGCNVGINLYPLIDDISSADFSSADAFFRSLVKIFPSRTLLDSKLQSTWVMQDSLQAMLKPGTVLATSDKNIINSYNNGSVLYRDRTDDSNAFLVFAAMAGIGTSLNRNGYAASDDPATLGYAQKVDLIWTDLATIKADTTHAGCSLASSMLNMFDSISAISNITSGAMSSALSSITLLQSGIEAAGVLECKTAAYSDAQCAAAMQRLRYRDACFEQDPAGVCAAGIIKAINAGWN